MVRRAMKLVAVVLALLATASACGASDAAEGRPLTVVLVPHPDDELQAWGALPADRGEGDVLLAFLTKGEETVFCDPSLAGLDVASGEAAPEPTPAGKHHPTCGDARVRSTVRFAYWVGDPGPGQSDLFHRDQWFVDAHG